MELDPLKGRLFTTPLNCLGPLSLTSVFLAGMSLLALGFVAKIVSMCVHVCKHA